MLRGECLRTHSALAFQSPGHRPAFWTLGSPTSWRLRQKCFISSRPEQRRAGSTLTPPVPPAPPPTTVPYKQLAWLLRTCPRPHPRPWSAHPAQAACLSRPGPADPRIPSGIPSPSCRSSFLKPVKTDLAPRPWQRLSFPPRGHPVPCPALPCGFYCPYRQAEGG